MDIISSFTSRYESSREVELWLEDYLADGRFRLNERFEALTRLHYDARTHRFNEQSYGLVQNLDNTWRLSYVVSLYSGPRRESHLSLNVQVEAINF